MFLRDANSQKRKRRGLPTPRQDNNYAGILHLLHVHVHTRFDIYGTIAGDPNNLATDTVFTGE